MLISETVLVHSETLGKEAFHSGRQRLEGNRIYTVVQGIRSFAGINHGNPFQFQILKRNPH